VEDNVYLIKPKFKMDPSSVYKETLRNLLFCNWVESIFSNQISIWPSKNQETLQYTHLIICKH